LNSSESKSKVQGASKHNILVLIDWFHPGFKAGGPIRSSVNFAYAMANDYNIWVMTSDTDHGADKPYENIETNKWIHFDKNIQVMYVSVDQKKIGRSYNIIKELNPEYIYINVVFSVFFSIYPLLLKVLGILKNQFVICPRGVFNAHGLATKRLKKTTFLKAMKFIGAFRNVTFHATTDLENRDTKKLLGDDKKIVTVPNFPPSKIRPFNSRPKKANTLSLVYIARVHPIKNLLFFLKLLKKFDHQIRLNIVGPIEDAEYWENCQAEIKNSKHLINYIGEITHDEVSEKLTDHDFLVLPTTGENFGHSILESFMASRPVIIANTTPWKDLSEKKVGWELTIESDVEFLNALDLAYKMDSDTYQEWSNNSWALANSVVSNFSTLKTYKKIFSNA